MDLKSILRDLYKVRPIYAEQAIEAVIGVQMDDIEDEFQSILKDSNKLSKSVDNLKKIFSSVRAKSVRAKKVEALVGVKPPKPDRTEKVKKFIEEDINRTIEKGIKELQDLRPKLSEEDLKKLAQHYPVVQEYEDIRKRAINLFYMIQKYVNDFRKYAPDLFVKEGGPKFGKIDYMINRLVEEVDKRRDEVWSIIRKISDKKVPAWIQGFADKIVKYIKKNLNPEQSKAKIDVSYATTKISNNVARFIAYIKISNLVDKEGRKVKDLYIAVYTDIDYESFSTPRIYVSVDYYFVMPKELKGVKCNIVNDALRLIYRDTSAIQLFKSYEVKIDKNKLGEFKKFVTIEGNTLKFKFDMNNPRHRKYFDDRGFLSHNTQADIIVTVQKALGLGEEVEVMTDTGIERVKVGSGGRLTTPRHYVDDKGYEVFEITLIPV